MGGEMLCYIYTHNNVLLYSKPGNRLFPVGHPKPEGCLDLSITPEFQKTLFAPLVCIQLLSVSNPPPNQPPPPAQWVCSQPAQILLSPCIFSPSPCSMCIFSLSPLCVYLLSLLSVGIFSRMLYTYPP